MGVVAVCNKLPVPLVVERFYSARMVARTEHTDLDARSRALLKTLVESYVSRGRPVGSRMLARSSGLSLSAATVRNVMADLEAMGYVASPHASAGRVPTVLGYRVFVDNLLSPEPLAERELADIEGQLRAHANAGDDLLQSASLLLSSLSDMTGVVTVPRADNATLRQIEFLPLSGQRVLVILVINQREVQNRILATERDYSRAELERAANYINARFAGTGLATIRSSLASELENARDEMNRGILDTLTMARSAFVETGNASGGDFVLAGETNLMGFPEFARSERLKRLFEAFQSKRDLLSLFDDCLDADGVRIFIGEESGYRVLDDCSVVSAAYTVDGRIVGTLGVIGPTRMAYERIIPLVDATASLLGTALKKLN